MKSFGRQLVSDRTALNKEAHESREGRAHSGRRRAAIARHEGTFDKDFLHMAVEAHNNDIKAFEAEAKNGEDPAIKSLAQKALPTLRAHLKMRKDAQQKSHQQTDSTQSQH
ncbi:MAG: DUF4142 domain-containing protein [Chthoniobacterales bacterium]